MWWTLCSIRKFYYTFWFGNLQLNYHILQKKKPIQYSSSQVSLLLWSVGPIVCISLKKSAVFIIKNFASRIWVSLSLLIRNCTIVSYHRNAAIIYPSISRIRGLLIYIKHGFVNKLNKFCASKDRRLRWKNRP